MQHLLWACLLAGAHAGSAMAWPPLAVPSAEAVRLGAAVCPYSVRVFVYEFDASLPFNVMAAEARRKPRRTHLDGEHLLAQFSLEFVLADFFEQSCVRERDPSKADFFFVPFYSDIEYRLTGRRDEPSRHGQALLDILERNSTEAWVTEFGVTDEWWRRFPDRHLLVQAAPVTGWRHPKGRRGWSHLMVQLHAPLVLSIEVTRSWALQYPKCAHKNIVLPYPIPGFKWHENRSQSPSWAALGATLRDKDDKRPLLAYYSGGRHGCVNVRDGIAKALRKCEDIGESTKLVEKRWRKAHGSGPIPRQVFMQTSVFCPCPEGDSPSAKRQYDALLAGCVPVIVSDDALYSFDEHLGGPLDARDFALRVPEQEAVEGRLLEHLRAVTPQRTVELQRAGRTAAQLYRYYAPGAYDSDPMPTRRYPDGGALSLLALNLERRITEERDKSRWLQCAAELAEPHYAHTKQFCGSAPRDQELWRAKARAKTAKHSERPHYERGVSDWEQGRIFRHRRTRS